LEGRIERANTGGGQQDADALASLHSPERSGTPGLSGEVAEWLKALAC
jgi:hypothetical protein